MAKTTSLIRVSNVDLAAVKAWITAADAMLVASGLTRTADTGQLDIGAIPAASQTMGISYGYTVYAFSDSLQGSAPIIIRIDWGTGYYNNPSHPGVKITVGSRTNGGGTHVGARSSTHVIFSYHNLATEAVCRAYHGDGFVAFHVPGPVGNTSNACGIFFAVERFRDAAGNARADGFVVVSSSYTSEGAPLYSAVNTTLGLVYPSRLSWPGLLPEWNTWNIGGTTGVAWVYPITDRQDNPITSVVVGLIGDFPTASSLSTLTVYGAQRQYVTLQNISPKMDQKSGSAVTTILMRWD